MNQGKLLPPCENIYNVINELFINFTNIEIKTKKIILGIHIKILINENELAKIKQQYKHNVDVIAISGEIIKIEKNTHVE